MIRRLSCRVGAARGRTARGNSPVHGYCSYRRDRAALSNKGASRFARRVLILAVPFLLSSCAPEFRILYTSSLNGNLQGCDCWGFPEAGLDKRAYYLAGHPKRPGDLLLDAGNILEEGRQPFLAELILETYRELGYDAVAVGLNELAEGADTLASRSDADPPFLSHNLLVDGRRLRDTPLLLEAGEPGSVMAVISLADPDAFGPYLKRFAGRITVAEAEETLAAQMRKSREAGASGVVLLVHGREAWIRKLAEDTGAFRRSTPPVAAVVLAGEEKVIEERLPGGVPLVSPGEEGNRLGILEIRKRKMPHWRNEFIEFHFLGPGDETVAARGAEYRAYLGAIRSD